MRESWRRGERGYAMAAVLVAVAVSGVLLGVAMPVWRTAVQRDREEELVFRGRQYARAIQLYQRKFANAYPPSVDVLVQQRFLRKKYTDPVNKNGDFEILYQATLAQRLAAQSGRGVQAGQFAGRAGRQGATAGGLTMQGSAFGSQVAGPQGGVVGVASKSTATSIRTLDGRTKYNEWQFVWVPSAGGQRGGQRGQPMPGRQGLPRGFQGGAGRAPGGAGRGPGGAFTPR